MLVMDKLALILILLSAMPCFPVHPEQLPQRPWITLKERDQMIPTGKGGKLLEVTPSTSCCHCMARSSVIYLNAQYLISAAKGLSSNTLTKDSLMML